MRVAAVLLLLLIAVPAAGARRDAPKPAVAAEPVHATFVEAKFMTAYVFRVTPRVSIRRVTFHWTLAPPSGDPHCTLFAQQNPTREGTTWVGHASWLHGDQHGCHHDVTGELGHPGVVAVEAVVETRVLGTWRCGGGIHGTITQTSPYVSTCRKAAG